MPSFYVTGCDSGFGRDIVARLYGKGHQVFAGCLLRESLEDLEQDFPRGKGNVVPIMLDVTDEESVLKAAEKIMGLTDRLDGLVNNAGILIDAGSAEWSSTPLFRKMLEVNVIGTSSVTKSVASLIRAAQGRIVNVASLAGGFGFPCVGTYVATKFAVEGYSDSIRQDFHPWGVTVHVIEPGIFPMTGLYSAGATFKDAVTKRFEELPQDIQKAYGEGYLNYTREVLTHSLYGVFSNRDRSKVSEAMEHALLSPSPKYRYRVGLDSRMFYLISFLPEWLRDTMFEVIPRWIFGVDVVLPAQAPKDGLFIAKERYSAPTRQMCMLVAFVILLLLSVMVVRRVAWS